MQGVNDFQGHLVWIAASQSNQDLAGSYRNFPLPFFPPEKLTSKKRIAGSPQESSLERAGVSQVRSVDILIQDEVGMVKREMTHVVDDQQPGSGRLYPLVV